MTSRRERLRAKVLARTVKQGDCLLWTGPTSGEGRGGGYGRVNIDGGTMATHIVIWTIEHGPIPPRKQIDHTCRNRLCVELGHLELVTHKKNQVRRAQARKGAINCVPASDFSFA